jgi:hypothetical protein
MHRKCFCLGPPLLLSLRFQGRFLLVSWANGSARLVSKKPYEFDQDWTIFDLDKAMTDFDFVVDIRKSPIASLESC